MEGTKRGRSPRRRSVARRKPAMHVFGESLLGKNGKAKKPVRQKTKSPQKTAAAAAVEFVKRVRVQRQGKAPPL